MKNTVRDSEKTRQSIMDALERILIQRGFTGVGVNAVAREAGVDKVLIYRYFGSMEGLLNAFKDEKVLCPSVAAIIDEFPKDAPISAIMTRILLRMFSSFRESSLAQELARWELTERNPLTIAFSRNMEQRELNSLAERGIEPDADTVAAAALLIAGLHFMTLRQTINNPIMKLDLSEPEIVKRIENVVERLITGFFTEKDKVPYVKK